MRSFKLIVVIALVPVILLVLMPLELLANAYLYLNWQFFYSLRRWVDEVPEESEGGGY